MEDRPVARAPVLPPASSISTSPAGRAAWSSTGSSRPSDSVNRSSSSFSSTFTTTCCVRTTNGPRGSGCERVIAPTSESVMRHRYDHRAIGCLCLYTTPQVMLEDLMTRADRLGRRLRHGQHDHLDGPDPRRRAGWAGRWSSPSTAAARAATRSSPIESPIRESCWDELYLGRNAHREARISCPPSSICPARRPW